MSKLSIYQSQELNDTITRYELIHESLENGLFDINAIPSQIEDEDLIDLPIWWSKTLRNILGIRDDTQQILVKDWYNKLHPEDRNQAITNLKQYLSEYEESKFQQDYRLLTVDGTYGWFREEVSIIRNCQLDSTRVVGVIRQVDSDVVIPTHELLEQGNLMKPSNGQIHAKDILKCVVHESAHIRGLLKHVMLVAKTNSNVLISGATGTGKELFAQAVYKNSNRNNKPLIKVNCASLPSHLIESELFGYEKGSFTGAYKDKPGKFELAHNGTIFLDEIGELPISVQAKLLRILQEGELPKLGSTTTRRINVRVLAATNRNLEDEIAKGNFREDLYYRLNVFPIHILPLAEHKEDIEPLVHHFIKVHSRKLNKKIKGIHAKSLRLLKQYDFPGNTRELENMIVRSIVLAENECLCINETFFRKKLGSINNHFPTYYENERDHIVKALKQTWWKVSGKGGAAELLNLKPTTLEAKMKKLGINRSFDKS